ncbi:hypothetical protein BH11ARM2_BH11ARM2_01850 [soil metagenome]
MPINSDKTQQWKEDITASVDMFNTWFMSAAPKLVNLSHKASGIKLSGLAGLYVHFIMIAHKWLEPDAVSAWLIPSEFMDVNYGDGLKSYLTKRVELLRIHRFTPEDVQFDDALITSTVVIFRNRAPNPSSTVRYTCGGTMASPKESSNLEVAELAEIRKWSTLPKASDDVYIKPVMTLGEAFTIKRGLATGDNDFFIRPRAEFEDRGIPREFLKPILPSPRKVRELTVQGDTDGYPLLEQKLALFDCALSEFELEHAYPAVWAFVQEGQAKKIDQGYLCNGRKPWYSQERREASPLVCTYMGRPKEGQPLFRIIRNRSKATATNVYLLLYPKPWLVKADYDGGLIDRICTELRLLSSGAFTSEGRVYGGGLHKMEPKELARLPLHMTELIQADKGVVQGVLFEKRKPYLLEAARVGSDCDQ